jgi:chromosome segregation ATPase
VEGSDLLDDEVDQLFAGQRPEGVTAAHVFSPLIALFDSELGELAQDVRLEQKELLRRLKELQRTPRQRRNYDEEIRHQQAKIAALTKELKALPAQLDLSGADEGSSQLSVLSMKGDELRQVEVGLRREIEELEVALAQNLEELSHAEEIGQVFKTQLDTSTKTVKQYRATLKMIEQTGREIDKNSKQLYERGQKQAVVIQKLQFKQTENEKRTRKLKEAFANHQQLVASYKLLEDRIKEQERLQEMALTKMVDAVELREAAAAEAQKNRMTRDGLADELRRVKELTANTVNQFEAAFTDHCDEINAYFQDIFNKIREKAAALKTENEQIIRERDRVQQQLSLANQENDDLKGLRTDSGFNEFMDSMASLKAEIDAASARKEQLTALSEKTKLNTNDMKAKLFLVTKTARSEQVELNQRTQKLELELKTQRLKCHDLLEKNAKTTAENQRLRNDVLQAQRSAAGELERRLKDKESELAEVRIQVDDTEKATAKATGEMQQAVLAFRQHADKWKVKVQSISLEASDARQNAESEQQQMIDEINRLEDELKKRKQLKAKSELMLRQLDDQIKLVKALLAVGNKKERQQAASISQLLSQQNAFSAEKGRNQILLDELTIKIHRLQRAIETASKAGRPLDDSMNSSL